jgi:hypothetical protein
MACHPYQVQKPVVVSARAIAQTTLAAVVSIPDPRAGSFSRRNSRHD